MKKFRFVFILLAFTLALSSCGFAAKNLAKQTVEAAKQMADLQDKAQEIEENVAALSDRDRRTYQAELERLCVVGAPEWLYSDEAALLTGAPEEMGDERGGILGSSVVNSSIYAIANGMNADGNGRFVAGGSTAEWRIRWTA